MKSKKNYSCTLLKLERIKQNRGQKEVCHGICVPSYLSKIENNQVSPDPDILKQLFMKLGIDFYYDEDFINDKSQLIEEYFRQVFYGLEKNAYNRLKVDEDKLSYSPLAIDWLLVEAFEEGGQLFGEKNQLLEQLSCCLEMMNSRQLALYYLALPLEKGKESITTDLYLEAYYTLRNSSSLMNVMQAYFVLGQYDKVHQYSDTCISLALEEGNTLALASTYRLIGDVYAALSIEELMLPLYRRAINLLQNTNWKDRLDMIYYNMGATFISSQKYVLALEYLNKVNWQESFLLDHKKALALIRSGKIDAATKYLNNMEAWIQKEANADADVKIEELMLQEALYECQEDFLQNQEYLKLLEKLMEELKKHRHRGYLLFYKDIAKEAYCIHRRYKKALELEDLVSYKDKKAPF